MTEPKGPSTVVNIESGRGIDTLDFSSPILSNKALDEFSAALESLSANEVRRPLVLRSSHPTVFLAGAHLAEIANLDSGSCVPYSNRGRRAIQLLEQHPAPTVAAVNGSCSGGGFDLVLACDLVVAGPGASFVHPGVRRGLVTGWTGTTRLRDRLGHAGSRSALLQATDFPAASLLDTSVIRHASEDPYDDAIETARRLASLSPNRWRLWRGLKGPGFVDRFEAFVVHKL